MADAVSPSEIIFNFQSALAAMQAANKTERDLQDQRDAYVAQRQAETKARLAQFDADISAAEQAARAARNAAASAKSRLDGMMSGVEDGSVVVEAPAPGDVAAAATIADLRAQVADYEQKVGEATGKIEQDAQRLQDAAANPQ